MGIVYWNNEEIVPKLRAELEEVRAKLAEAEADLTPLEAVLDADQLERLKGALLLGPTPVRWGTTYNGTQYLAVESKGLSWQLYLYTARFWEPLCVRLEEVAELLGDDFLVAWYLSAEQRERGRAWLELQKRRWSIELELEERGVNAVLDMYDECDSRSSCDGVRPYGR